MQEKRTMDELHRHLFDTAFITEVDKAYAETVANGEFKIIEAEYQAANEYVLQYCNKSQKEQLLQIEEEYRTMQRYAIQYAYSCGIVGAFEQLFIGSVMPRCGFDALVVKGLFTVPQMERHAQYYKASNNTLELSRLLCDSAEEGSDIAYHVVSIECAWEQRIHSSALYAYAKGFQFASSVAMAVFPETTPPRNDPNSYFEQILITNVGENTDFFTSMNSRIA